VIAAYARAGIVLRTKIAKKEWVTLVMERV
jgi:hypothetical protein